MLKIPLVEMLGFLQDEGVRLWGCWEPLIIRQNGNEKYLIHHVSQYRDEKDSLKIKSRHRKIEYASRQELLDAWGRLCYDASLSNNLQWQETDKRCGHDIPEEEFNFALERFWINKVY